MRFTLWRVVKITPTSDKFYLKVLEASNGRINLYSYLDKLTIFNFIVGGAGGGGTEWNKVCCAALNFLFQAMRRRAALVGDMEL